MSDSASDVADAALPAVASPLWMSKAGARSCRRGQLVVPVGACPVVTPHCIREPVASCPLGDRQTREVLQLSLHHAQVGNLQAASTLPLLQGVPTPHVGL